ncbi:EamA family transporter [Candidatus Woesearchaeota archaeon]|nr:EamA family transporter [Candidatus Woesearchaeota archaeon]
MNIPWYAYAIAAALLHSAFQIIRKKALLKVHSMNFESTRALSVALLALFLIPFINLNISRNILLLVYLVSVIGTGGILLASKALRHEEISLITPLGNLRPAFVAVLAFVFLRETLAARQIGGIVILLLAAYLLESDHHFSDFIQPIKHFFSDKYSIFFVLAVLFFSVNSILDKFMITNHLDIFSYFFLVWMFIAINFNIIHIFFYGYKDTVNCFKKIKYLPLLVGGLSMVANLLALKALSMAYVSLVAPVLMLSTLFIVLVGGEFFHERYIYFRLSVSLLMLVGAYLIII